MAPEKPSAAVRCLNCYSKDVKGPFTDDMFQCLECGYEFVPVADIYVDPYEREAENIDVLDFDPVQRQEIDLADMAYRADLMGASDYDPPDPDEAEWYGR
ncbi:MAG: hypothetical protein ACXADF_14920 [Candidatus Thorarchaeota archaeon]|jgi:hypothetical protein